MRRYSPPQQTRSKRVGRIASYDPGLRTTLLSIRWLITLNANFIIRFCPYSSHRHFITPRLMISFLTCRPFHSHLHRIDILSYRLSKMLTIDHFRPFFISHYLTNLISFIRRLIRIFIMSWILGSLSCKMPYTRPMRCRL